MMTKPKSWMVFILKDDGDDDGDDGDDDEDYDGDDDGDDGTRRPPSSIPINPVVPGAVRNGMSIMEPFDPHLGIVGRLQLALEMGQGALNEPRLVLHLGDEPWGAQFRLGGLCRLGPWGLDFSDLLLSTSHP